MRGATFQDFSVHATGFSQWLMTDFPERRIHSAKILEGASLDAPKIFSSAGALPSRKTICQSLFAIRCRLTIRHSLFAIGYSPSFRLGRSLALPFFPSLVPRPVLRGVYKSAIWCYINCMEMPRWRNWQTRWLEGPVGFTDPCGFKSRPRHHFLFGRFCSQFFHSHP